MMIENIYKIRMKRDGKIALLYGWVIRKWIGELGLEEFQRLGEVMGKVDGWDDGAREFTHSPCTVDDLIYDRNDGEIELIPVFLLDQRGIVFMYRNAMVGRLTHFNQEPDVELQKILLCQEGIDTFVAQLRQICG